MQKYAHLEKRAGSNGRYPLTQTQTPVILSSWNRGRGFKRLRSRCSFCSLSRSALLAPCGFIHLNRFMHSAGKSWFNGRRDHHRLFFVENEPFPRKNYYVRSAIATNLSLFSCRSLWCNEVNPQDNPNNSLYEVLFLILWSPSR